MRLILIGASLLLACLVATAQALPAPKPSVPAASSPDDLSARIYRLRLVELAGELSSCRQASTQAAAACEPRHAEALAVYAQRFYAQEAERRDVELSIHRWQIMAANVMLALVALLTVAAVVFCGWQLWRASRMSKLPPDAIQLEVSVSRLKLQTSIVGLAVLVAAYGFLLVFTREVYQIRPMDQAQQPVVPQGNTGR